MPELGVVADGRTMPERLAILRSNVAIMAARLRAVAKRERFGRHVVIGGLVFWLPAVGLHALSGTEFSILEIFLLTFIMPGLATFALIVSMQCQFRPLPAAVAMVLGIYVLGPSFQTLGAWLSGGGPFTVESLIWLPVMSLFQVSTLMMATYDATLLGVILGTAALLLLGGIGETVMPHDRGGSV